LLSSIINKILMANKNTNKFYYIAEFCLPVKSAYSIHVLKMCDNIEQLNYKLNLIIPSCGSKFSKIKHDYNLKNTFNIISIFKKKNSINFLYRIIFALFAAIIVKKNSPNLVITRSLLSSFFLSILKKKHYLEIHGNIYGLSNFLFRNLNYINSKFIIKIIFITKSLAKFYKIKKDKYIVAPDGFDKKDFKYKFKKLTKISKFVYTGSFTKGKGVDTIIKIAKLLPHKKFYLYGNKKKFLLNKPSHNVFIHDHVKYKYIPKILSKADVLLMPYEQRVFYNQYLSDDIGKFHSPLKMFEYLASGKLLISSNQKVLKEILNDKINCLMVKKNNFNSWLKCIRYAETNQERINKIIKFAKQDSKKYSWEIRIKNILQ
jgi:glycosyltransferase involved in cell wall biosynthesis